MSDIKLTSAQKEVVRKMREGGYIWESAIFIGNGYGRRINKNTLNGLRTKCVMDNFNCLTEKGKTIKI